MAAHKSPRAELVREYAKCYPKTPTKTLARLIYRINSKAWPSFNACYASVRRVRGTHGNHSRSRVADRVEIELRPENSVAHSSGFGWIPKPKSEWDAPWQAEIMEPGRWLILPDIHIPYHDPQSIGVALQSGMDHGVDSILLNGDLADFFSVSRWEKDPTKRDLAGELVSVREFLAGIRSEFPEARIVWKLGNHEERWQSYLWSKAPELAGVPEFSYESIFKTDEHRIKVVGDMRPLRFGKLFVLHGHEYRFSISNPVNPARGFFLRAKDHILGSHLHQPSNHKATTIGGLVVSAWSTGCLCDLHPGYRPLNDWAHGFALVDVAQDGGFQVHNRVILGGKAYPT